MSYKRNSKSRIARLLLALTLMGGVGQRMADRSSYAYKGTSFQSYENLEGGVVSKAVFEFGKTVEWSKDDFQEFCNLLSLGVSDTNGYEIKEDKIIRGDIDIEDVKTKLNSVFESYVKFAANRAVSGLALNEMFAGDLSYENLINNAKSEDFFKQKANLSLQAIKNLSTYKAIFNVTVQSYVESGKKIIKALEGADVLLSAVNSQLFSENESESNDIKSKIYFDENSSSLVITNDLEDEHENCVYSDLGIDQKIEFSIEGVEGNENADAFANTLTNNFESFKNSIDREAKNKKAVNVIFGDNDNNYLVGNGKKNISLLPAIFAFVSFCNDGDLLAAQDEYNDKAQRMWFADDKKVDEAYQRLVSRGHEYFVNNNALGSQACASVKALGKKLLADVKSLNGESIVSQVEEAADNANDAKGLGVLLSSVDAKGIGAEYTKICGENPAVYVLIDELYNKSDKKPDIKKVINSDQKKDKKDVPSQPGEKKGLSTGAKVAMGITIPAVVLAAAGVALWQTGYGAKIINKVKDLMKGNKGTRPDIKFNGQGNKPVVKN